MIQKPKNILFFLVVVVLASSLFSSCTMKGKLQQGEYFVYAPDIQFAGYTRDVEDKNKLLYELSTIVTQKPNTRWLKLFRTPLWIHYKNEKGKWKFFKKIAEDISVYKEEERFNTEKLMTNYLKRQGFFDAEVTSKVSLKKFRKLAKVKYYINPGKKYYVGKFHYESTDSLLVDLIPILESESLFKLGAPISEEQYYRERKRATKFLQNQGYAYFAEDYFSSIEVDTTENLHYLDVRIKILTPSEKLHHEKYKIRKVIVYPDYKITKESGYKNDTIIDGVFFFFDNSTTLVKPKILVKKIHVRPGDVFHQGDLNRTTQSLTQYEIYKFSTLKYFPVEGDEKLVDIKIYLTRGKKRFFSGGVNLKYGKGGNSTLLPTDGLRFLSFGINSGLENKNVFGGGEVFRLRPDLQLEFNPKSKRLSVFDVGLSSDILIHKFIEVFHIFKGISKKSKKDGIYQSFKNNGNTNFSLILNTQRILFAYRNRSIETKMSYDLVRNYRERIIVNQMGVDFLKKDKVDSLYQVKVLDKNPFLSKSLENQLFTGFFYKSLNYFKKSKGHEKVGFSWSYYINHDISGLELMTLNKLLGLFNRELPSKNVKFAKFTKLDVDLRALYKFNPKTAIAYRFFAGGAVPYGNSEVVPFVKQYYVGGYNSMRGWGIRELGPGSYRDTSQVFTAYQKGDLRFETNLEYRFGFYKFLSGALFVDAGNIWTLKDDPNRPGAKFTSKFYNQIAVSTGFGVRFDFGLGLFRVDFGHKTRSPFLLENGKYWQRNFLKIRQWNKYWNISIGLDYPF